MSKRNQRLKRHRYYMRRPELLDGMAETCGLEPCEYGGECDCCDFPKPTSSTWARMSYGEATECDHIVCSECVPEYYRAHVAEMIWYGGKKFWPRVKRIDRQCRYQETGHPKGRARFYTP